MSKTRIRIGISTCPNDTFAFHALLTGVVSDPLIELDFELLDVEELNCGLAAGRFDVAKGSFHAGLHLSKELLVLPVGAALGFGVGPVVLSRPGALEGAAARVLCPGRWTTASLLWQLFHSTEEGVIEQRAFHEILPALKQGEADLGVCIHEARFTYEEHGLDLIEDLGETWEQETGSPLPLGGLFARRSLPKELTLRLSSLISESLTWARAHPELALESMRAHAQEFDDEVLMHHVELYVNERTSALGEDGARALGVLHERARLAGLLEADAEPLVIFSA